MIKDSFVVLGLRLESFNGKLSYECVNETLFGTLGDTREVLEE